MANDILKTHFSKDALDKLSLLLLRSADKVCMQYVRVPNTEKLKQLANKLFEEALFLKHIDVKKKKCSECGKLFDVPRLDWQENVACPECTESPVSAAPSHLGRSNLPNRE
ncbi:MAG: hypothetical protein ACKVT0_11800, partial [Planctomycetaceae bacterium]